MGTAGNLSVRINDDSFLITASGKPKGQLSETDFVSINLPSGKQTDPAHNLVLKNKPSAETSIHQAIYNLFPTANACFHIHSIDACLATQLHANENELLLPNLEMIKGFDVWDENPNVNLPLFDNYVNVSQISKEIEKRFANNPPKIDALMIKNHGITVWGDSIQQAFNRVEILEFIMSFLAKVSK